MPERLELLAVVGAMEIDLRRADVSPGREISRLDRPRRAAQARGSNTWAIAGSRTDDVAYQLIWFEQELPVHGPLHGTVAGVSSEPSWMSGHENLLDTLFDRFSKTLPKFLIFLEKRVETGGRNDSS